VISGKSSAKRFFTAMIYPPATGLCVRRCHMAV